MSNCKFYLLGFIVILFLLVGLVPENNMFNTSQLPLSNEFNGTYVCESNAGNTITVDLQSNTFYYWDNLNEIYFRGIFEKAADDNSYTLISNHSETQMITCKDLKFHFIFNDKELLFEKFSNSQYVPSNMEDLLVN